ncbi:hypothetical protein QA802_41215 [Streptomyces sp. B21-105]|uniref:hypothetical protein n=1 Tax=Streptomyces sp. B21-105 TaxID=3039417 RepID=UPI002FEFBE10
MMTLTQIRRELQRLVGGERTEETAEEAARLLEEYRREEARARRPEPTAEETAAAARAEEDRRWRRTLTRIGRGRGAASTVVWSPGAGREGERAWVRQNEERTYLRRSSPWR